jgi:hypothetical protein
MQATRLAARQHSIDGPIGTVLRLMETRMRIRIRNCDFGHSHENLHAQIKHDNFLHAGTY